jgi:hypothetical protein
METTLDEKLYSVITQGDSSDIRGMAIYMAMKNGMYFNPDDYNEDQLKEFLKGIHTGLSKQEISRYFRKDYDVQQMTQIRRAILDGLSEEQLDSITDSGNNWMTMAYLRHKYLSEKMLEMQEQEKTEKKSNTYTEYTVSYSDIKEEEGKDGIPVKVEVTGHSCDSIVNGHTAERNKYIGYQTTPISIASYLRKSMKENKMDDRRKTTVKEEKAYGL